MVLGCIVQYAIGRRTVALRTGHALFKIGVIEVKKRQALLVCLLRIGLRVVDAADTSRQQISGWQIASGVIIRGLRIDKIGDPVLGLWMIGLVHFNFISVVVCAHDRAEPGELAGAGQAPKP
ncbi:Uncharacterised protein [Mycobacteroides abscessus subsp. abscessus]|nr:Uncharacterised protein [Mycobacteroides abscessus subsp. abscessus]